MPEIRYFRVTQTREVMVTANNPADAVVIADAAFSSGQNSDSGVKHGPNGIFGNTTSRVKVTDTSAYES